LTEQISWVFFTIVYRIQTFLCYYDTNSLNEKSEIIAIS
jgi:hypothetical protein